MNKKSKRNVFLGIITLWISVIVPQINVHAQGEVLSIDIDVSAQLANSQVISLSSLGVDAKGSGPVLISGVIQNLTTEMLSNLYFEFSIASGKRGEIVYFKQKNGFPFSLAPMQTVYVTNNAIKQESIPGISEQLSFNGGLTPEGDNLVENLDGALTLPPDTYAIRVTVFQITDALGRQDLATSTAEIGNTSSPEASDIFLRTPGDVIDGNVEVTNPYPQFSWDGELSAKYRLLVVKDSGEGSPESLLESAKSTLPINEGGSLLAFENLDVIVEGNNYQFPASGAQPLEAGHTYYWQIITSIKAGAGTIENASEIWSFKLSEAGSETSPALLDADLKRSIIKLIGESRYNQLQNAGFNIQGLEIDGVPVVGPQISIKLAEIIRKIEDGDIILGAKK